LQENLVTWEFASVWWSGRSYEVDWNSTR